MPILIFWSCIVFDSSAVNNTSLFLLLSASSPWSIRVSGATSGTTEEKGVEPHPFLQWTLSLGHLPQPYQEKEEAWGHQLEQQRPGKGCSMLISKSGVFSKDVAKCQCTCCGRRSVLPHQRVKLAKEMSPQIILNKPHWLWVALPSTQLTMTFLTKCWRPDYAQKEAVCMSSSLILLEIKFGL